eukprot:583931-Lingulodinium_polyedra.AAC.1
MKEERHRVERVVAAGTQPGGIQGDADGARERLQEGQRQGALHPQHHLVMTTNARGGRTRAYRWRTIWASPRSWTPWWPVPLRTYK